MLQQFGATHQAWRLSFQQVKPSLQLGDDGLLLGDEGQQGLPAGGSQVKTGIHA